MLIKSFQDMDDKSVKFVPISMNYEKVLEGNSYFKETMGDAKKQESLSAIFRVAKDFRGYLGEAYMQFADPIDLKDFLDTNSPNWKKNTITEERNNQKWLFDVTPKLGKQIMVNINKAVVVTSSSILASAILSANKFTLSEENLSKRISLYLNLIKESEYSLKIKIPETNPEKIISKVKKLRLIKEDSDSTLVKLNRPEAAMLSFYKNNIAHLLLSLIHI